MRVLKLTGDICLIFLVIIAMFLNCFYIFFRIFNKDFTLGVNNIDDQLGIDVKKEEDLTEEEKDIFEERYFLHANVYENKKNNGIELQEIKINYFTNYDLTSKSYRSTGMQFIGDHLNYNNYFDSTSKDKLNNYVYPEFYYYDTTDNISWSGYNTTTGSSVGTKLNRNQIFIIKIDNRAFSIQLNKEVPKYKKFFGFDIKVGAYFYDYSDLFNCIIKAVKSNNYGYGDYYIKLDLSDLFTIKEYNIETGKFKEDNVTDIIKNYSVLKLHYEENGAKASSQSLFKSIECNPQYGINEEIDTSYWQERAVFNLTEKDLNYRYNDIYKGYFSSLSLENKNKFENMPRSKVKIKLDLNSQFFIDNNINLIGFDYNAFENFEIDTLTITGSGNFNLMEKSLFNTNIKLIERSRNINFIFNENAINNDYREVIV